MVLKELDDSICISNKKINCVYLPPRIKINHFDQIHSIHIEGKHGTVDFIDILHCTVFENEKSFLNTPLIFSFLQFPVE